ncbi:MAG: hypothetical protein ACXQTM_08345 [Methanosarcinales archaeon]
MKFVVERTSTWGEGKPCDEAVKSKATWVDRRKANSVEEAKRKPWFKDWYNSTINHREENGFIVGDRKGEKEEVWVVELRTLEDFVDFVRKYEQVVVSVSFYKEYPFQIEIYDAWRE